MASILVMFIGGIIYPSTVSSAGGVSSRASLRINTTFNSNEYYELSDVHNLCKTIISILNVEASIHK